MATTSQLVTVLNATTGRQTTEPVDANLFGTGTLASRPASGTAAGDMYIVNDTGTGIFRIDIWDGTAWQPLLGGPAKEGKLLQFGSNSNAPNGGTLNLEGPGGTSTVDAPLEMFRTGTITAASVLVDTADATNDYDLSIILDGTEAGTLALASTNANASSTALAITVTAGEELSTAMVRTAGAGASDWSAVQVMLEIVWD